MADVLALLEPARPDVDGAVSCGSLIVESGEPVTLWSGDATTWKETDARAALRIPERQHVVIGRQHDGPIEYLHPNFQPTHLLPQTGQSVPNRDGDEPATWVSRGHFMLRAWHVGLVLVNGVPRPGGFIRPPLNGTLMLRPDYRAMHPREEFLIEPRALARIRLPNGTVISIQAD